MTYAAPLKATLRLVVYEEVEGQKRPKNIIEKEVYLGELPDHDPARDVRHQRRRARRGQPAPPLARRGVRGGHPPQRPAALRARIIPFRGSWVEFTIDIHDVIYVHIDKKKKFPATALLRAFGYGNNADILRLFFATKELNITGKLEGRQEQREVIGALLAADVPNPEDPRGEPLGAVGDELTQERLNEMRHKGVKTVTVSPVTRRSTCGKMNGDLVAGLGGGMQRKINIKDREYFLQTVATQGGRHFQPYRNRLNGRRRWP